MRHLRRQPHAARAAKRGHADAKRGEPHALDAIIDEGTLTIGWVGPALLGILIAAFVWGTRVFQWLRTLATWLFSGGVERQQAGREMMSNAPNGQDRAEPLFR